MFIKIENRFEIESGINTELIECDRYEMNAGAVEDRITLLMYKDGKLVAERNFANRSPEETLPETTHKKQNDYGTLLTIYIMNDSGETVDKIIM